MEKGGAMQQGAVDQYCYASGYGTIRPDDGKGALRFFRSQVVEPRSVTRDQRVEYEVELGPKGPEAVDVRRV
jgi:cold shock CspA family protein